MPEKKSKHASDIVMEDSEAYGFIIQPSQVEIGSAYSLSIKHDENRKPVITLKTYGTVDLPKIMKQIEQAFPNAQIQPLRQNQPVIVSKKPKKKRKTSKSRILPRIPHHTQR